MKSIKNINKYISVLSAVLSVTLLNSCNLETIVDLDIPQQPETLVVSSAFSQKASYPLNVGARGTWDIFVTHSEEGSSSTWDTEVTDATVRVKDLKNGEIIPFVYSSSDKKYIAYTSPTLGHSYELSVVSAKYGAVSSLGQTLPETKVKELKVISVEETVDGTTRTNFQMTFEDPKEVNHYRLRLLAGNGNTDEGYLYSVPIYTLDPNVEYPTSDFGGESYGSDFILFRDNGYNGKEYTMSFYTEYYYYDDSNTGQSSYYTVLLSTLSGDLYQFEITKAIAYSSGGGGLFVEPINIYSNINDGFGVFAGYSWDTLGVQYSYQFP